MIKKANLIPHMDDSAAQNSWVHNSDSRIDQQVASTAKNALIEIQSALTEEARTLQKLLATANINVTLSAQPFSQIFTSGKSVEWAKDLLINLQTRVEIVRSALEQDISLDDNKGLFWLACRRFNLKPSSEMLERIKDSDVLEIYTLHDKKQVFSNFRFWDLVSYPIDEILSHEFYELFDRSTETNEGILNTVYKVATTGATLLYNTSEHLVKELHSPRKYNFKMKHGYMGPMLDRSTGVLTSVVSTLEAIRLEN